MVRKIELVAVGISYLIVGSLMGVAIFVYIAAVFHG